MLYNDDMETASPHPEAAPEMPLTVETAPDDVIDIRDEKVIDIRDSAQPRIAEKPTKGDYIKNADAVLDDLKKHKTDEVLAALPEKYRDPNLHEQAKLIVLARAALIEQERMPSLPGHEAKQAAKANLVRYNHLVRDFIDGNEETVSLEYLEDWMGQSTNNLKFAHDIVYGAAGEVALAHGISGLGGVHSVVYGNVEEDMVAIDLKVNVTDGHGHFETIKIDVKTPEHLKDGDDFKKLPEAPQARNHYQIGIAQADIGDKARLRDPARSTQLSKLQQCIHVVSKSLQPVVA